MGASVVNVALPWVWLLVALFTLTGFFYTAVRWARSQFRDAVLDDIKPLLEEIGLSVNNVGPGEPKLVERVKQAQAHAASAATNAELAKAMSEENGSKMEELGRQVATLSGDVQVMLGSDEFKRNPRKGG